MSVYTDTRYIYEQEWYIQAINYQNDWLYDIYERETETQETAQIVNEAELEKAEFDKASTVASTQLKIKIKIRCHVFTQDDRVCNTRAHNSFIYGAVVCPFACLDYWHKQPCFIL